MSEHRSENKGYLSLNLRTRCTQTCHRLGFRGGWGAKRAMGRSGFTYWPSCRLTGCSHVDVKYPAML